MVQPVDGFSYYDKHTQNHQSSDNPCDCLVCPGYSCQVRAAAKVKHHARPAHRFRPVGGVPLYGGGVVSDSSGEALGKGVKGGILFTYAPGGSGSFSGWPRVLSPFPSRG